MGVNEHERLSNITLIK